MHSVRNPKTNRLLKVGSLTYTRYVKLGIIEAHPDDRSFDEPLPPIPPLQSKTEELQEMLDEIISSNIEVVSTLSDVQRDKLLRKLLDDQLNLTRKVGRPRKKSGSTIIKPKFKLKKMQDYHGLELTDDETDSDST